MKVTVTERGRLDPCSNFFTTGDCEKLVYCASRAVALRRRRLGQVATVVDGGQPVDLRWMVEDLHDRGVRRLMVEGGGRVHTQFLTADLADELHLVVAPFFVGDLPRPPVRRRRRASPGTPAAGRTSPRPGRSATSCCCATPCRRGSPQPPEGSHA